MQSTDQGLAAPPILGNESGLVRHCIRGRQRHYQAGEQVDGAVRLCRQGMVFEGSCSQARANPAGPRRGVGADVDTRVRAKCRVLGAVDWIM